LPPSCAAAGDDHRRGAVGQQAPQVHFAVDVVQPQLDQFGSLLDQVSMLGDHVAVAAAGNADANHGRRFVRQGTTPG
jgi:hypothetical protein